jgi:ankyrin repeat protein
MPTSSSSYSYSTMNAGSIAGARPRPSIAGPRPRPSIVNVVSTNNIAVAVAVADTTTTTDNDNIRFRSNSISTVVTSNKKRQLHNISPTNGTTNAANVTIITSNNNSNNNSNCNNNSNEHEHEQELMKQKRKMLLNIHPTDYAKAGFKANGYQDFDLIIKESIQRFIIRPSPDMIAAYSTDIVMAVRTNNVHKAREIYLQKENSQFNYGCNACNRFGESILHIACRRGHMDMVKFLIEEVGLRVDTIRDDYHRTPLHDAFWTPIASYDVVDFLLRQPNVVELLLLTDVRGYTPLDYARSEDRGKWLRFLWERKSILHPTSSSSNTSAPSISINTSSNTTSLLNTPSSSNTTSSSSNTSTTSSSITVPSTSATTMKEEDVDTDVDTDTDDYSDDYTDTDDDDITVTTTTTTTTPAAITTAVVIEQQQQQEQELLSSSSTQVFDINNKRPRLCG